MGRETRSRYRTAPHKPKEGLYGPPVDIFVLTVVFHIRHNIQRLLVLRLLPISSILGPQLSPGVFGPTRPVLMSSKADAF